MKKTVRIIAMLLLVCVLFGCAGNASPQQSTFSGGEAVTPSYPAKEENFEGMDAQAFRESEEYWEWRSAYMEQASASREVQDGMEDYYREIMRELLVSDDAENKVCSPLNIYVAFAMLAECTDAGTREQILEVLGADGMDSLRACVQTLWEANYVDTPVLTSLLADSLWLRDGVEYQEETLRRLSEIYYASSYSGVMGTEEMDRALQEWMNENTGHLLEEAVKEIHTQPETVLALVSTIYFKAAWLDRFSESATSPQTFHGATGDTQADMMHLSDMMSYYEGTHFQAVQKDLNDSGSMFFFLPEEGKDVTGLVTDDEVMQVLRGTFDNVSYPMVTLSVPKFRAEAKTDLLETIKNLGMTDVLIPGVADFSPLTTDENLDSLYLSSAEHAAVVEIDEDGVTGAAYTIMMVAEGAAMITDEVDFTVDRPFFFAVTAADGSILFAGIVQNVD